VPDGGDALHGLIQALKAPGAMTVPIESSRDASQQLTLVKKVRRHHMRCSSVQIFTSDASQAADGRILRTTISETLFSKGKAGTCRDAPPQVEAFDAASVAGQVIAIEDFIKRSRHSRARTRTGADARTICTSESDLGGNHPSKLHAGARRRRATWSTILK
jgi:hypothetical protein